MAQKDELKQCDRGVILTKWVRLKIPVEHARILSIELQAKWDMPSGWQDHQQGCPMKLQFPICGFSHWNSFTMRPKQTSIILCPTLLAVRSKEQNSIRNLFQLISELPKEAQEIHFLVNLL